MALVTYKKYAELCDCHINNIRYKVKSRTIKPTKKILPDKSSAYYIDTKKYPPLRLRKKKGEKV